MAPHPPSHPTPTDPALAAVGREVLTAVSQADPLTAALLGEPVAMPDPDEQAEVTALARLAALAGVVERFGVCADAADDVDRQCLLYGLRRAVAAARPADPTGPVLLERHLQLSLLRVLGDPADGLEELAALVDAGPGLLRRARRDPAGGSVAAGQLALESARRMPALLDACAGAVGAAGFALRTGVEAGLGALLQASAEESGWLLKEYLPAARELPAPSGIDPVAAGLGMSLPELEAEAEAALAEAVGEQADQVPAVGAPGDPEIADLEAVARAWDVAGQEAAARWGPAPDVATLVTAAPPWLAPLLPAVSLWQPGALATGPFRLLVGSPHRASLASVTREVYEGDFMPAAFQRTGVRLARLLLPLPELQQGWRAHVRAAGAGPANWGTELAWRAGLALAALALAQGRVSVEDAAGLIAAEAGLPADQALLQAMTIAQRPLAALSFLAGRLAVMRALSGSAPAHLLANGPLPAVAIAG